MPTTTLAIVTLILGLLAPPLALIAVPLGHLSRKQIRQSGERGDGMAKASLIVGYFWVAVQGMAVLLVVVQLLPRG
jgi:uncharacterized protein DUF4190